MTLLKESGSNRSRHNPVRYKRLSAAIAATCAATASAMVWAQEPAQETIRVTGSYIERAADRPQPVAIIDQVEIQANQRVSLVEVVRDMPQITSANTSSNWEAATNSINLRGLGARSTLVLLNGQRMTIDASRGSTPRVGGSSWTMRNSTEACGPVNGGSPARHS